jgi:hypothetical protein
MVTVRSVRSGEAPAHITHFYHRQTFAGTPDQMLDLVDVARAAGQDVTFDAYPYEWASTRLLILIPIWVQDGGPGPTKERLADRAVRDRIRDELTKRGQLYAGAGGLRDVRLGQLERPANRPYEGRTLGALDDRMTTPSTSCDLPRGGPARTRSRWALTDGSVASCAIRSDGRTDSTFVGDGRASRPAATRGSRPVRA